MNCVWRVALGVIFKVGLTANFSEHFFTSVWPHVVMNQVMLCCVSDYLPMDNLNWEGFA